jgi:hypothetical protein
MADSVREALSAGFRNAKHRAQWKSTLETYAAPLRLKPVDTITCAYRISNPSILVVQPAQDRAADNASGCLVGA